MEPHVLDACVAVALVLPEQHSEAAARFLAGAGNLVVPDVYFPEAAHALLKQHRRGALTEEQLLAGVETIEAVSVETAKTREFLRPALELAAILGLPGYDAFYLMTAIERGCRLVTCDHVLFERATKAGLGEHVAWLPDVA